MSDKQYLQPAFYLSTRNKPAPGPTYPLPVATSPHAAFYPHPKRHHTNNLMDINVKCFRNLHSSSTCFTYNFHLINLLFIISFYHTGTWMRIRVGKAVLVNYWSGSSRHWCQPLNYKSWLKWNQNILWTVPMHQMQYAFGETPKQFFIIAYCANQLRLRSHHRREISTGH